MKTDIAALAHPPLRQRRDKPVFPRRAIDGDLLGQHRLSERRIFAIGGGRDADRHGFVEHGFPIRSGDLQARRVFAGREPVLVGERGIQPDASAPVDALRIGEQAPTQRRIGQQIGFGHIRLQLPEKIRRAGGAVGHVGNDV